MSTGMRAVHSIPAVVAAPRGIIDSYNDIGEVTGHMWARTTYPPAELG